jgi:hypothetical protein
MGPFHMNFLNNLVQQDALTHNKEKKYSIDVEEDTFH